MRTRPPLTMGLLSGAVIGVALIAIFVILARSLSQQALGPGLFLAALLLLVTLPLLGLWLYGMAELFTLHYAVDRNRLTITTLFVRHTIPHGEIRELIPGQEVVTGQRFRGISWPGLLHGITRYPGLGKLVVLSTEPYDRQLLVVANGVNYGISPHDPVAYAQAYERFRALGPLEELPHATEARAVAAWPVWRDRAFWVAAALGLAANLALIAYAIIRYTQLPAIIPMYWDAFGEIGRLAPKEAALWIPAIGTIALVTNLLAGMLLSFRERFGARLMVWSTVGIQAGLWWAALGILAP